LVDGSVAADRGEHQRYADHDRKQQCRSGQDERGAERLDDHAERSARKAIRHAEVGAKEIEQVHAVLNDDRTVEAHLHAQRLPVRLRSLRRKA
jgi:hypothetical protein